MMETFLEYIAKDNYRVVIDVLCRIRVKEADKQSKYDRLRRLSSDIHENNRNLNKEIYQIMPPRRRWIKLGNSSANGRYKIVEGCSSKQRLTACDYNKKSLKITIDRDRKTLPCLKYVYKLECFINDIVECIKDVDFSFKCVSVIPIVKKHCDDYTECRPITRFTNLRESIILILANKYLTKLFDDEFYDESLAFRSSRTYHEKTNYVTSHHDAIELISDFRSDNTDGEIFVAECDMQKFYDTVSHVVVRREFSKLLSKKKKQLGIEFDEIKRIFNAYLKCYSFPQKVYKYNNKNEIKYWNNHKIKNGKFKWVEKEMLEYGFYKNKKTIKRARVGVPQGGALSGLIANMVLNYVDECVKKVLTEKDLYIRYCDDMILMSTNKERCGKIFNLYKNCLKEIRLIPHEAKNIDTFSPKGFWKHKTKDVYCWKLKDENCPEWIGFVGYEIKRDGCIRVRKSSLLKEIKKQRKTTNELLKALSGHKRVSDDTLKASYTNHLINMSVGKVHVWNAGEVSNELCWINGFRELNDNVYVKSQMRKLDKCRNNTIHIAESKLLKDVKNEDEIEPFKRNKGENKQNEFESGALRFYGKPFSYFYHYQKNKK